MDKAVRLPGLPESLAIDLSRAYLLAKRRPMLAFFLDRLGLDHEDGIIAGEPPAPDGEALGAAVAALREVPTGFSLDVVRLYLTTLYAGGAECWKGLAGSLSTWGGEEGPLPPQGSVQQSEPGAPEPPSEAVEATGGEHLTTLDDVLTRTILGGVTGIEGELGSDKLYDLVNEVLHLNLSRHRSFFHLGFLHALLHRPLEKQFEGSNPDRRLWYFTGAVVAFARYEDWKSVLDLFEAGELSQLGQVLDERARQATKHVVRALIRRQMGNALPGFLRPELVIATGSFGELLLHARELFQEGRLSETDAILELLRRSLELGQLPREDRIFQEVERLRAHCSQWRGELAAANSILEGLLGTEGLEDRAAVLADKAMADHGLRGLFDVVIREQNDGLKGDLRAMIPRLEEAAGRQGAPSACPLLPWCFRDPAGQLRRRASAFGRGAGRLFDAGPALRAVRAAGALPVLLGGGAAGQPGVVAGHKGPGPAGRVAGVGLSTARAPAAAGRGVCCGDRATAGAGGACRVLDHAPRRAGAGPFD